MTERTSDTLPKTEELSCNATSQHSTALGEDDRAGDEQLSISVLTITKDQVQDSPKTLANFDNLDGPTIVGEVCKSLHVHMPISHQATATSGTT